MCKTVQQYKRLVLDGSLGLRHAEERPHFQRVVLRVGLLGDNLSGRKKPGTHSHTHTHTH